MCNLSFIIYGGEQRDRDVTPFVYGVTQRQTFGCKLISGSFGRCSRKQKFVAHENERKREKKERRRIGNTGRQRTKGSERVEKGCLEARSRERSKKSSRTWKLSAPINKIFSPLVTVHSLPAELSAGPV